MATREEKQYVYERTEDIVVPKLPILKARATFQTKRSRGYWIGQIIDAHNSAVRHHAEENVDQYIFHYIAGSYYSMGQAQTIYQMLRPFISVVLKSYKKFREEGKGRDIFLFYGECARCGKERAVEAASLCRKCHFMWEDYRKMCKEKRGKECKLQKGILCEYRACPLVKKK